MAINLSYNRAIGTSPFVYKKLRLPEMNIYKKVNQPRILVTKRWVKTIEKEKCLTIGNKLQKEIWILKKI